MEPCKDKLGSLDLAGLASIPIASLDPSQPIPTDNSIKAVVSLLWPYSSSNHTFALLLTEPDFRLRNKHGQVRIQLRGGVAEKLAQSHISIGDQVHLSLQGSQWVEDASNVKTPGSSINSNLLYKSRILLQIYKEGEDAQLLDVELPVSPVLPPQVDTVFSTPKPPSPRPTTPKALDQPTSWSTPVKFRSSLGFDDLDTSADHIFEEEEFLDERPRKRARFSRGTGRWRFITQDSNSNEEESRSGFPAPVATIRDDTSEHTAGPPNDTTIALSGPASQESDSKYVDVPLSSGDDTSNAPVMGPPKLPLIHTDLDSNSDQRWQFSSQAQSTPKSPKLKPIASAVLPLVSPLTSFQNSLDSDIQTRGDQARDVESSKGSQDLEPSMGGNFSPSSLLSEKDEAPPSFSSPLTRQLESQQAQEHLSPFEGFVHEPERKSKLKSNGTITIDLVEDQESEYSDSQQSLQPPFRGPSGLDGAQDWGQPIAEQPSYTSEDATVKAEGKFQMEEDVVPISPTELFLNTAAMEDDDVTQNRRNVEKLAAVNTSNSSENASELYSHPEAVVDVIEPFPSAERTSPNADSKIAGEQSLFSETGQPTPGPSQESIFQAPTESSHIHVVDAILDGQPRLSLITPKTSEISLDMVTPQAPTNSELTTLDAQQQTKLLKVSRRSSNFRSSEVPSVLSTWFTSRREPQEQGNDGQDLIAQPQVHTEEKFQGVQISDIDSDEPAQSKSEAGQENDALILKARIEPSKISTKGLRTALSFYSPLSTLDRYLNNSSQLDDHLVDVIAAVSSPTAKPNRAKAGPRDFNTYFKIFDSSSLPESIQVQVFRPFKESLPTADVGDVVLLRNFRVKSRSRQGFLLSEATSAWYVWRYRRRAENRKDDSMPIWATAKKGDASLDDEECTGPPVEIGVEEQKYAAAMRELWESVRQPVPVTSNDMANGHNMNAAKDDPKDNTHDGVAIAAN